MKNLIVVCGPTASGKTRLGIEICRRCAGEVLSVDSRQVYRGMDIGTGKDLCEYDTSGGNVAHHLIDIADPHEIYTLYKYQRDFYRAFREIRSRCRMPVAVGGTGLYLEAVLKNYEIPAVPENAQLRKQLMELDRADLDARLLQLDRKIYERTDRSSKKRLIRAIEIAMSDCGEDPNNVDAPALEPIVLCVVWDRKELRARIDRRLEQRLRDGMVDEVKKLIESGVPLERFALFGMEYRHVARYLTGQVSYDAMVEELRHAIHQLAKRQETWFRGMERRGTPIHWVPRADLDIACEFLINENVLQYDAERLCSPGE